MALRDDHDFLSENERQFLANCLRQPPHVRADGRELLQQRKIRVQFRRSDSESQAEVQLGRTRDCATLPDRPTEGFLHFAVELSPMASPSFEASASAGRGAASSVAAAELARLVERGVRESRALDTEALAVVAGEKVWAITCHVHVVDHGGNLVDAASLAAIAALMHYRRPEVAVKEGTSGNGVVTVYSVDEHAAVPLSLHHIPISISFCFLQPAANMHGSSENDDGVDADEDGEPIIFMDPTDREERITDARMSFTFNSFRELCAVHKIGGAAVSQTTVLRCANVAAARVVELTTFLKEEEEKADKEAVQRRRSLLRGRAFADISSTLDEATAKSTVEHVDLGAMTDFSMLHAPIALRDDQRTRRLFSSETVRDLIHGSKKQQPKPAQPAKKKPMMDSESDSEEEEGQRDAIERDLMLSVSTLDRHASGGGTSFRFDQVLSPGIDQAGVFRWVGSDVVDGALSGYNSCILAYGQTGAGKTFTMSGGGPRRRFEDRGLIARSLSRVFQRTQQDADHSYALRMSYLEIYNDRLIDLLGPDVGTGETNRVVAEHALNAASTRSHCIFTLYLERKRSVMSSALIGDDVSRDETIGGSQNEDDVVYSKLHLVDLAGSERMRKTLTEAGSTRANEACYINRSLTFLEQVVLALGSKNRAHVPFRQTPLTNLLKDSLGGNCRTLLVACVWPAPTHTDQSLATLRFAARMRRVKTQAIVNIIACGSGSAGLKLAHEERAAYRDEIRRLREELVLGNQIPWRDQLEPQQQQQRVASAPTPCKSDKELFEEFKSMGGADPGAEALRDLEQAKRIFAKRRPRAAGPRHTRPSEGGGRNRGPKHAAATAAGCEETVPRRIRAAYEKKAEVGYLGKIKAQMLQQVALQFQSWRDQQGKGPETAVTGEWPG
ncbi:Kinesin-like protein [Phytophthora cactorum]|nr:Kinesin-like protein [Phytophthora cactorum]